MRTFLFECKKMIIFRKGWIVILLTFAAALGYWQVSDTPAYEAIEIYRDDYEYFLQNVNGRLTEEKRNYIEAAATQAASANKKRTQLYLDFYAGKVSEDQLKRELPELCDATEHYGGVNALYDQYIYVRQQPESRYMVYPNGWAALLGDSKAYIFLMLALFALIIPLFCDEYICEMDRLTITTFNGSKNLGIQKSVLAALTAVIISIFITIERWLFCLIKYGLPDAGCPIQSLECYANCPYSISMGQAFVVLTILQTAGAVYLAMLTCCAAVLTRRYAASCLLALCVMGIPSLAFSDSLQFHLPLPLSFLRAIGFLLGSETVIDDITGEKTIVFSPVTIPQMLALCFVSFLIIVLCYIYIRHGGQNKILVQRSRLGMPLFAFFFSLLVFSGCGAADQFGESKFPFNSYSPGFYKEDNFSVEVRRDGMSAGILLQKEEENTVNLVRSPFRVSQTTGNCIYGNNGRVYYMYSFSEDAANIRLSRRNVKTTVRVMCVSIDSMEEYCVFEASYSNGSEWSFLLFTQCFFIDEEYIWFVTQDAVWQVDRLTHRRELMDIPLNGNIAYDGHYIYYIDDIMRLCCRDTAEETVKKVGDVAAASYALTSDGIFYANLRDHNYLYFYDPDSLELRLIDESPVISLTVAGDELRYYVSGEAGAQTLNLTEE